MRKVVKCIKPCGPLVVGGHYILAEVDSAGFYRLDAVGVGDVFYNPNMFDPNNLTSAEYGVSSDERPVCQRPACSGKTNDIGARTCWSCGGAL